MVGERIDQIALISHRPGETVFAVSAIGEVVVTAVTNGTARTVLRYAVDRTEGIAASPDGRRIAVASHADVVEVVDIGARTRVRIPLRTGKFRSDTMFVKDDVLRVLEGTGQLVDIHLATRERRPQCSITDNLSYERDHENVSPTGLWRLIRAGTTSLAVAYEWAGNTRYIAWDTQSCRRAFDMEVGKARFQLGRQSLLIATRGGDALLYGDGRDVMTKPLTGTPSVRAFSGSIQPIEHVRVSPTRSTVVFESTSRAALFDWERQAVTVAPVTRSVIRSVPTDTVIRTNATSLVTKDGVDHVITVKSAHVPKRGSQPSASQIDITMSPAIGGARKVCSVRERGEYAFHLAGADGTLVIGQVEGAGENSWYYALSVLNPWNCTLAKRIERGSGVLVSSGYLDDGNTAALSPDAGLLASGSSGTYHPQLAHLGAAGKACTTVATSTMTASLRPDPAGISGESLRGVRSLVISSDGRYLMSGHENGDANVWDLRPLSSKCGSSGSVPALWTITGLDWGARAVAIEPTNGVAAVGDEGGLLRLYRLNPGGPTLTSQMRFESPIRSIQIMNSQQAFVVTADGAATLIDQRFAPAQSATSTGMNAADFEVTRFAAMTDDAWVATTNDGRFDTSNIESLAGLRWVVARKPLSALPLEIFTRDYYEPGLLPRKKTCIDDVLASPGSKACIKEFAGVRDLADLNLLQPEIKRIEIVGQQEAPLEEENPSFTVRVSLAPGVEATRRSGMHDLRLFVNGQLVQRRSSAGLLSEDPEGEDESSWRNRTRVGDASTAGTVQVDFPGVRLPHRVGTRSVEIAAYAFNEDKVKSGTYSRPFDLPEGSTPRRRRAVVIGFGVNEFKGALRPLTYAASDGLSLPAVLGERLRALKTADGMETFAQVLTTSLVTTSRNAPGAHVNDGRKEALHGAFQQLAGVPVSQPIRSTEGVVLPKLQPEDLLVLLVSTHGDLDARGTFYLAASETETDGAKLFVPGTAISSHELFQWFGRLSTAEFVLAIDACRSAGAIQDGTFKAGPLGNRGFGQFAYDKGMRVLAASQRNQASLEDGAVENGFLTFALLESLQAGALVSAGESASLSAWLREAERAVPDVHRRVLAGERIRGQSVVLKSLDPKTLTVKRFSVGDEPVELTQRPVLFDFYRAPR
jgi:WD40 repeat protein